MAACQPCSVDDEEKEHPDVDENATVKPIDDFNVEKDAKVLRKAMKGFGTDEAAIIEIVTERSSWQLVQVLEKYKGAFGRSLIKDLKSELKGKLEKAVIPRFYPGAQLTAYMCRDAMEGAGTDEFQLVLALCTKTKEQIEELKTVYEAMYERDLEKDVKKECSGDFENFLVAVVAGERDDEPEDEDEIDEDKVNEDVAALKEAGKDSWGTDEDVFCSTLNLRSYAHLRAVFKAYTAETGDEFENCISSEFDGDLEDAILTVVRTIIDPVKMWAQLIYKSMKGAGTNDDLLINCILMNCEGEMERIKKAFTHFYDKDMLKMIKDDCSGDYEKIMLALCKDNQNAY